ncbi:unnamed protein product [Linum tenue]|uniref:Uncharacterized protein n=1 Tax=Linum tenue TaxID=586396 RepID=A0AAV0HDS4_9ROSI|nr:unnamed protein product [Linum tenue]
MAASLIQQFLILFISIAYLFPIGVVSTTFTITNQCEYTVWPGILSNGSGAAPPATLAEFKLDGYDGQDFFDVSLVDGYNLPVLVSPQGGSGQNCSSTGCVVDLNGACPSDLKVVSDAGEGVPQYCCDGAYATPDTCKPSSYSLAFKNACPRAYSYAYDDKTSTFTCSSADYTITFCPTPSTR